jgi:hypothetical protein
MASVVAGPGISVDSTDPANPIVSAANGGTVYFTNPSDLNDDASPNGALGVLTADTTAVGKLITSNWVRYGGVWHALEFVFATANPVDWAIVLNWLDIAVNTNLDLDGCTATEITNGSNPGYTPGTPGIFRQDRSAPRFGNIDTAHVAPAGTATKGPQNRIELAGCTFFSLVDVAPDLAVDGVTEYEIHLFGTLEANGGIFAWLADSGSTPPTQSNTGYYAQFGTTQVKDGTFDAAHSTIYGGVPWDVVGDTTGAPLIADAVITLRRANETETTTGEVKSLFFDAVFANVIYAKEGHLQEAHELAYNGFTLQFDHPFTGYCYAVAR